MKPIYPAKRYQVKVLINIYFKGRDRGGGRGSGEKWNDCGGDWVVPHHLLL